MISHLVDILAILREGVQTSKTIQGTSTTSRAQLWNNCLFILFLFFHYYEIHIWPTSKQLSLTSKQCVCVYSIALII